MAKKKETKKNYAANVIVSIPTKGEMRAEATAWLLHEAKYSHSFGVNVGLQVIISPFPVDHTRNNQVKSFLETKATHMFLLDSDCEPEPETIVKLLEHDKDIVNSVCPGYVDGEVVYTSGWKLTEAGKGKFKMLTPTAADLPSGLVEIDACGATGVLIKRHVFETIPYPWFKILYRVDGSGIEMGEDFFFCTKAKQFGFQLYSDFSLVQKHYKTVSLIP
jgi:hypothetical protein